MSGKRTKFKSFADAMTYLAELAPARTMEERKLQWRGVDAIWSVAEAYGFEDEQFGRRQFRADVQEDSKGIRLEFVVQAPGFLETSEGDGILELAHALRGASMAVNYMARCRILDARVSGCPGNVCLEVRLYRSGAPQ